jgi:hypothetical protein
MVNIKDMLLGVFLLMTTVFAFSTLIEHARVRARSSHHIDYNEHNNSDQRYKGYNHRTCGNQCLAQLLDMRDCRRHLHIFLTHRVRLRTVLWS